MKEKETYFIANGVEYKAIFNLNVMQEIQNEYGTFTNWGNLVDSKEEPNIKALIFGIKSMLNEAIDIDNELLEQPKPFLTDKQVGRLITSMGLKETAVKLNETVVESTSDNNSKNE
jgi:hypothetical protein